MTIPDYCSVAPSLMGLTPTSRPPAQCLLLTAAIELVKHLSPSGRKFCKPLEMIVPSSSRMFTLISFTAVCGARSLLFSFPESLSAVAQQATVTFDHVSTEMENTIAMQLCVLNTKQD